MTVTNQILKKNTHTNKQTRVELGKLNNQSHLLNKQEMNVIGPPNPDTLLL